MDKISLDQFLADKFVSNWQTNTQKKTSWIFRRFKFYFAESAGAGFVVGAGEVAGAAWFGTSV